MFNFREVLTIQHRKFKSEIEDIASLFCIHPSIIIHSWKYHPNKWSNYFSKNTAMTRVSPWCRSFGLRNARPTPWISTKNTIGRDSPNCTLILLDFSCFFFIFKGWFRWLWRTPPNCCVQRCHFFGDILGTTGCRLEFGTLKIDQQVTSPQKCIPMCFQWVILTIDPTFTSTSISYKLLEKGGHLLEIRLIWYW